MKTLVPPKLSKGDLIGIIAPASPITDQGTVNRGVAYLEKLGYRVLVGMHVARQRGYLAGTDDERAADFNGMVSRKDVRAIICLRGGYGSPRILPLIDYRLIARSPKIIVGYSDITALQLAIWKKCRLVTFQGPMLGPDFAEGLDPYTEELFWRTITSAKKPGPLFFPEDSVSALHTGKARGVLLGGNLSLVVSLIGTLYQPDFRSTVLFLEDVDEEPYRIDRMLTQLRNASVFTKCKAILAGQFTDCVPKDPSKPSLSVGEILVDAAASAGLPFLAGLPFGHTRKKLTLPIGVHVNVDAGARLLVFLEGAVR